jgi:GAF domain-containing protein
MIQPTPETALEINEFQYDRWRSQFIKTTLWVFCAIGLLLIVPLLPAAAPSNRIFFIGLYLVLVAATAAPIPTIFKTWALLVVGYLAGMYAILNYGAWSDATVFFMTVSVLAAVLFDNRTDLWITGFCIGTLVVVGLIDVLNLANPFSPSMPVASVFDWLSYIADFSALVIAVIWAINLIKREFRAVADKFGTAFRLLTEERGELEQKINERTIGLTRKTEQLRAASYIARQTAEVQELATLLDTIVNLITDQFGFYHTGIFLMSETGDEAVLQAASSAGGKRMVERGHSLTVGTQGIVGYVAAQKKPRIALDVGADAVFFNNPDLPMTRSELALPLLIRGRALGVLDIQSDKPQAFAADDIDVLQTVADQVAIAIENARLLDESQATLSQLEAISAVRTHDAWSQKLSGRSRVFTYTPLGLRAERPAHPAAHRTEIPLALRGQTIGSISIARKGDTVFNQMEEELIAEVVNQAGLAIDNLRLLEEATQRAKQEQVVGRLATRFSQSLNIDTLLQTAARELGQLPDVAEVSVFIGKEVQDTSSNHKSKRKPE